VAYSNEVKENILGVESATLQQYGAVSAETVCEMAEKSRLLLKTDFAMAVSGIAGPDGGSAEKPVGLVYIAVASAMGTESKKFHFGEFREVNISRSAMTAMFMCLTKSRKENQ